MRWTIWRQRTTCNECGARLSVPEQGLTVTCEYCGAESPVPDAEQRRQKMEADQRRAEQRRARPADTKPSRKKSRPRGKQTARPAGAALAVQLLKLAVALAVVAGIVYGSGLWSHIHTLWRGDDGKKQYQKLRAELRSDGYTEERPANVEAYLKPMDLLLPMEKGRCYVAAVAAGSEGVSLELRGPTKKKLKSANKTGSWLTLPYCPKQTGVHTARLTLTHLARVTHGLLSKKAEAQDVPQMPVDRIEARKKRLQWARKRRKGERTKRARPTPTPVEPRQAPTRPPEPEPDKGDLEPDDEELRRALDEDDLDL